MTSDFRFQNQIQKASTIPSHWYFDPSVLAEEKLKVFSRTWQLVGCKEQVAEPGRYLTGSIGDEPVLVVRGEDNNLRAFSNVCRHRAGPVATGCGKSRALRCGYHGWTYSLDGKLLSTPEFDLVENFKKEQNCLPEFSVDIWGSLVFVNLDPECDPLDETFGEITSLVGHCDFDTMQLAARKDWHVDCNWKVYVDNYLEGYHIPIVHPSLNRELDYSRYWTETKRLFSIQHAPVRTDRAERLKAEDDDVKYFWIFPNLMLNVYADNYSTNLIIPLGPERTLTVFEWYFRNPSDPSTLESLRQTIEFSDEIQLEDIRICEAVQRGLRSRTYSSGRYSVRREIGVHHFHGLLAEYLSGSRGS